MGYRELQRAISILESSSSSSSSSSPFTAEVTSNATRHLKASLVGMTEELAENLLEYDLAKMQAGVAAISAVRGEEGEGGIIRASPPLPNQQRTLYKLPTELRCRNFC